MDSDEELDEIEMAGQAVSGGRGGYVRGRLPFPQLTSLSGLPQMDEAVELIVESLLCEDQVAKTIMAQITRGILMRVGARDFVSGGYKSGEKGLMFTVTGKRGYLSKILVTLEPTDTYRVRAWRSKKKDFRDEWKYDVDGIHADALPRVVEITYKKL